ncbi:auxin-responsive protein SAUR36-like [Salvia miltiorrhiza]|uniref:auxin-responsive protein SAUR36-like n=1 Tax=Salvia miltiorrhiza TaxID=226208 RepID=UPI0025AB6266|nr:auxin-responsive protein SAUR36-like [Salvia miltiorrhiza]
MGRVRGFSLKHRVATIFRRVFRRRRYRRLGGDSGRVEPFSRLFSWTDRLKTKAMAILGRNMDPGRGYIRVGQEIPKGHMVVYVGQKDGDFERILVPIVYINHPLFGDLLKESEKEFGYNHPGGLTIPCGISEFERVQTRIEAGRCTRKLLSWKKTDRSLITSRV